MKQSQLSTDSHAQQSKLALPGGNQVRYMQQVGCLIRMWKSVRNRKRQGKEEKQKQKEKEEIKDVPLITLSVSLPVSGTP